MTCSITDLTPIDFFIVYSVRPLETLQILVTIICHILRSITTKILHHDCKSVFKRCQNHVNRNGGIIEHFEQAVINIVLLTFICEPFSNGTIKCSNANKRATFKFIWKSDWPYHILGGDISPVKQKFKNKNLFLIISLDKIVFYSWKCE